MCGQIVLVNPQIILVPFSNAKIHLSDAKKHLHVCNDNVRKNPMTHVNTVTALFFRQKSSKSYQLISVVLSFSKIPFIRKRHNTTLTISNHNMDSNATMAKSN